MRSFRDQLPNLITSLMREAARFARHSVPVVWLAEQIGVAPERLRDSFFRLMSHDLIDTWIDEKKRPCAAFTPFGVQTLGIVYRERKQKRRASYFDITEADLWQLSEHERCGIKRMDDVADPGYELHGPRPDGMTPGQMVRWDASDYSGGKIPAPTVLLGERLQWPVPGQATETGANIATGPCAGCGDHPRDWEFCLICFRYPMAELILGLVPRRNGNGKKRAA